MDTTLKDLLLRLVIVTMMLTVVNSIEQSVCLWDNFQATCAENEVIQMEHAHYGRMSVGRCIPEAHKMGCQEDVLSYLDSVCSGRQTCQLRLLDYLATKDQPCQLGLTSYLHLQYNCTSVQLSPTPCAGEPLPMSETPNLLANDITERTGQGTEECPWEIRGSPGQKIRLTLLDYGVWTPPPPESGGGEPRVRLPATSDVCRIYARLTEDRIKSSIVLCGGERREKVAFVSETERVYVAVTDPKHSPHPAYFLLRYEILGCPNYIPPEGAVMTRYEKDISVTCPDVGSEWHLSCDGTRWQVKGNVTNCTMTEDEPSVPIGEPLGGGLTLPQGILLIFIIAIAVLIAVIILVIGLVSLRKKREIVMDSGLTSRMRTSSPGYNCKEDVPMLTNQQRATQERGYTTTVHRHMPVAPGALAAHGEFPPLPPPPTASYPDDGHDTVHTTSRNERYLRDRNHSTLTRPYTEHIKESPRFPQHTRCRSEAKDHFYYELDPEHTNFDTVQTPDQVQFDTETSCQDPPPTHLPDVLSTSSSDPNKS